jgi:hypothetical protein
MKQGKKLVTLTIEQSNILPEQMNYISQFISMWILRYGKASLNLVFSDYPMRLKGSIKELSSTAREYFLSWNKEGYMRNIGIVERSEE